MSSPIDRLLEVARSQLGIHEEPPGSNLQKYGAWYGNNGVSWCDQFVSWVADQAGLSDAIEKSQYVPYRLARARQLGEVRLVPAVGALACYDWGGDGIPDHIGIIEEITGRWTFTAIEGNTSSDDRGSQSNGDGVYRRHRVVQQVAGFIYPMVLEDHMPLTQADADLVATAVLKHFAGWAPPTGENPAPNWQTMISRDHTVINRIAAAVNAPKPAPVVDVNVLAAALAKLLPAGVGVNPTVLAEAVADELAARMTRK